MDKNLSASAGDMCSIPGPGRFHMPRSNEARVPQLLSLRSRACKPQLPKAAHPEPVLRNQRSRCDEEPWATRKRSSHSLQPEKARAKQRRPSTAGKKEKFKKGKTVLRGSSLVAQSLGPSAFTAKPGVLPLVQEA